MAQSYAPCRYQDSVGIQCDVFFPVLDDGDEKFCPMHRDSDATISNENLAVTTQTKARYIDIHNAEVELVKDMTIDQIDQHILGIEAEMAKLRARAMASRGTRIGKLEMLTEDERKERRKIKIVNPTSNIDKPAKISSKKDPIGALAQTLMSAGKLTHEDAMRQARAILES